ncbi:MAG: hypothetical protein ACRDZ6_13025 [Acidimicrobiales bacterium]
MPDAVMFRDGLIDATALVHHMAIVTRKIGDFERFDELEVVNPWR